MKIHRRGFLASIMGMVGSLFGVRGLPKLPMTYGGGTIYGLTNLPNRIQDQPWTDKEVFPVEGHLFDWTGPPAAPVGPHKDCDPFTTDPQWKGKLGCGPHQRISVDGKDVSHLYVQRFFTGPFGWVEELVREGNSWAYLTNQNGDFEIERKRHYGHVRFWVDESITSY